MDAYRVNDDSPGNFLPRSLSTSETEKALRNKRRVPGLEKERPREDNLREFGQASRPKEPLSVPIHTRPVDAHRQARELDICSDRTASHAESPKERERHDDDDDTVQPHNDREDHDSAKDPISEFRPRNSTDLISLHTFAARASPLTGISPNHTPKPSVSPDKLSLPADLPQPQQNSLSTAITSLLAHHQRNSDNSSFSSATAITTAPLDQSHPPRRSRKRQLLGRAPSNLSARSLGSRASSVDTMNTDGVGTPLEPASFHAEGAGKFVDASAKVDPMTFYAQHQDEEEHASKQQVQLTQLSYEDPEVGAWRERVVRKMKGGKQKEKTPRKGDGGPRARTIGTVRDIVGSGTGSVARRTRHAGAR